MHINIDTYIQDYHESGGSKGLHCLDARVKLILLVAAVAFNIYFAQLWLSSFLFIVISFNSAAVYAGSVKVKVCHLPLPG